MQASARKSSRLMSKLKSSFSAGSKQLLQKGISGSANDQKSDDQQLFDTQTQLDTLDQVLTAVEDKKLDAAQGVMSQALPTAVAQVDQAARMQDELNPPKPRRVVKEAVEGGISPDTQVIDAATGIGYVEQEKIPELPPEVEGFLKKVEAHAEQLPKEIVIADGTTDIKSSQQYPAQPVIVIPITSEIEKKGKRKNSKFSIRWLVEWSFKVMKMFSGKVVYREVESEN